jgi:hypothetical protein
MSVDDSGAGKTGPPEDTGTADMFEEYNSEMTARTREVLGRCRATLAVTGD